MKTTYTHIQMTKSKDSKIVIIETSLVSDWFNKMIEKGIDISECVLLKITQ